MTLIVGGLGLRATRRERRARALVEHRLHEHELAERARIVTQREHESQLRHMADHDPLTGLLNRRAYERAITAHIAQGRRYGHEGAVLMLDLDEFKQVNDTLGHSAGDELIVSVSRALTERLRSTDTVARLGGDEFAILLPRATREDAEHVAGALLDTVRSAHMPQGCAQPISASIGVAPLAGLEIVTVEQALSNADLAMYDAKKTGRDRFVTYSEPSITAAHGEDRHGSSGSHRADSYT